MDHVGPTKSLTFSRGPKGCHGLSSGQISSRPVLRLVDLPLNGGELIREFSPKCPKKKKTGLGII